MRGSRLAALLALPVLALLAAPAARAGDDPLRAADVTERGRDVDRILDVVLTPAPPPGRRAGSWSSSST